MRKLHVQFHSLILPSSQYCSVRKATWLFKWHKVLDRNYISPSSISGCSVAIKMTIDYLMNIIQSDINVVFGSKSMMKNNIAVVVKYMLTWEILKY